MSHAVGCSGIDNGFVECEDRVVAIKEMLWYLPDISVESYGEHFFVKIWFTSSLRFMTFVSSVSPPIS